MNQKNRIDDIIARLEQQKHNVVHSSIGELVKTIADLAKLVAEIIESGPTAGGQPGHSK